LTALAPQLQKFTLTSLLSQKLRNLGQNDRN
jgi:hypothetical protein